MEEQGKAIIIILQTLARRGAENARRSLGLVAGEHLVGEPKSGALRRVVDQYPRLGERDLADLMKAPLSQQFPEGHFIELESSRYTDEGYSFLWCGWNLEGEPRGGFFYGMFRLGRRHVVEGEAVPQGHVPQFWGYRFETPSWQGTEHRFNHAQPTESMSPARVQIGCSLPRSTNAPTFPLPYTTLCGLLLTLVLATLGRDKLDEIIQDLQIDSRAARNAYVSEAIRETSAIVRP